MSSTVAITLQGQHNAGFVYFLSLMMLKGGLAAIGQYSLHAPLLSLNDSRACKV